MPTFISAIGFFIQLQIGVSVDECSLVNVGALPNTTIILFVCCFCDYQSLLTNNVDNQSVLRKIFSRIQNNFFYIEINKL